MAAFLFVLRVGEFLFYSALLRLVDAVCRLPRHTTMPEAERLYRENVALKAQLDALEVYVARLTPRARAKPRTLAVRASQVFAWLLTRGNEPFQRYFLSTSVATIQRWARRLVRRAGVRLPYGGRPPLDKEVEALIVTLKRENRTWGARRIQQELRRQGVRVSEPTIQKVLRAHGLSPQPGRKVDFARVTAAVRDALWAVDFFAVRTARGAWLQVLLVIDIHTRELLDLRVHDGWDVDSGTVDQ